MEPDLGLSSPFVAGGFSAGCYDHRGHRSTTAGSMPWMHPHLPRPQRHDPAGPRGRRRGGPGARATCSATRRASTRSASRRRRALDEARSDGGRADRRRAGRDRLHRRRHRGRQPRAARRRRGARRPARAGASWSRAIEHEAVLNTAQALGARGWPVDARCPVGRPGRRRRRQRSRALLADDAALVSVMHANNEIGIVQPVARARGARARARRAVPHRRGAGRRARSRSTCARSASTCCRSPAHKFDGPKGAGALWIRRGTRAGQRDHRRPAGAQPPRRHRERAGHRRASAWPRAWRARGWRAEPRTASARCAIGSRPASSRACRGRAVNGAGVGRVPNTTQHQLRRASRPSRC